MTEFAVVDNIDLASNGSGNDGTHWRIVIPAAYVLADAATIKVLIDHVANWSFSSMWIGHRGSGYNFDGSQVQVFFGGNPGLAVTAETVSDAVTYAIDATKDLIISVAVTSSSLTYGNSTGKTGGYASGGDAQAAATASGALSATPYIVAFKGLSGDSSGGGLISLVASGGAVAGGSAEIDSFVGLTSYSMTATGGAIAGGKAEIIFGTLVGYLESPPFFIDYTGKTTSISQWDSAPWRDDLFCLASPIQVPEYGPLTNNTPIDVINWATVGDIDNSAPLPYGQCMTLLLRL